MSKKNKKRYNIETNEYKNTNQVISNEISDLSKTREIQYHSIQEKLDQEEIKEKTIKETKKKGNPFLTFLKVIFLLISLGVCYAFAGYKIYNSKDAIDKVYTILNYGIFAGFCTFFTATIMFIKTKLRNFLGIFTTLILVGFVSFNLLVEVGIINLPRQGTIPDFTGETINDALLFTAKNNIEVAQINEYSDNIDEGRIITQDVKPDTLIKKVKKITFTVSNGPDYSKDVLVNDMVGLSMKELEKFIEDNHLNNVKLVYEINNTIERDIIISQSYKGEMKRNTSITFKISLGKKENLKPVKMENLVDKTTFDATLWLMKNGIDYKTETTFSDTIKKGNVVSQSIEAGKEVDPTKDSIKLMISKGKKIVVPNLTAMSVDEIVSWVVENNLKLKYNEAYSSYAKEGVVIKATAKEGDSIEEGTTITITTSKGQLKFPSFKTLAEFKSWANNNGINYKTEYEYNDKVPSGGIISFSLKTGDTVILENTITVKISYGKAVTVPYFVGMSKSAISSKCANVGLNCTFYYTGYSNTAADVATTQSVNSGNKVVSGTYVSIGLSSGPAKTFTVYIQSTWFTPGNADATISTLKSKLATAAPGVTFNFVKKSSNSGTIGYIHPNSPTPGGNGTFKQGSTYTIWIIS